MMFAMFLVVLGAHMLCNPIYANLILVITVVYMYSHVFPCVYSVLRHFQLFSPIFPYFHIFSLVIPIFAPVTMCVYGKCIYIYNMWNTRYENIIKLSRNI